MKIKSFRKKSDSTLSWHIHQIQNSKRHEAENLCFIFFSVNTVPHTYIKMYLSGTFAFPCLTPPTKFSFRRFRNYPTSKRLMHGSVLSMVTPTESQVDPLFSTRSRQGLYLPNMFNPFPKKPWFLRVCGTSLLKTLWEKEKLLVTSNFSFSHSVCFSF